MKKSELSKHDGESAANYDFGESSVRTGSLVKKFWLTAFGGYSVSSTIRTPKKATFGGISYSTAWILRKKK